MTFAGLIVTVSVLKHVKRAGDTHWAHSKMPLGLNSSLYASHFSCTSLTKSTSCRISPVGFLPTAGSLICDNSPVVSLPYQVRANATALTKAGGRDRAPKELFVRRMEHAMVTAASEFTAAGEVWVRSLCFRPNVWHRPLNQTNPSDPILHLPVTSPCLPP